MTSPTSEPALATKILVVEDDPNIVDLIRSNLAVRGFDTVVVHGRRSRAAMLETEQPDLILLDLMLPSVDGFELCKQVRERSSVGVIVVLSARRRPRQGRGAQPRRRRLPDEAVQHRRAARADRGDAAAHAPRSRRGTEHVIALGDDLEMDLAGRQVTRDGAPLHLTPTEFALLRELVGQSRQVADPRAAAAARLGAGV